MSTMNNKDINSDTKKVPALLLGGGDLPIIHEHINSKDNPHGVTRTQLGAAPADAVIDEPLEVDQPDGAGTGFEGYGHWEKYLNGQFWFGGVHESAVSVDLETGEYYVEIPIFDCDMSFPFGVYDETYSYIVMAYTEGTGAFELPEGLIELTVEHQTEYDQPVNCRWVTAYATDELYTKMIEEGVDYLDLTIELYITGRWREEQ